MKANLKSEKGAITLVVLVAMLFLLTFLMSLYIGIANKAQTSAENTKQIAERYNNIGEAQGIYDNYFADTEVIPIYTKEQLAKIGSGEQIKVDGKIYTFAPNAYYTIQKDLDLGGVYNESTGTWSGTQWIPLTNDFTGTLDGLGNTITAIYLGANEGTQGIFQELNGTIKNLNVKDSYKKTNMNGLLAGTNNGEIINCYYEKVLIGLKTGDYVNYEPTAGTYTVASGTNGSGYTSNQSFSTEDLEWRILSINEKTGEIELVAATQTKSVLYLQGADGYNHAVDILNDMCEELYSNTNGAKARSINVEDINAKTTYDYTTYTNYGTVYTPSNKQYPNIYTAEEGSTASGLNGTGLKGSEGVEKGTKNASGVTEYTKYAGSSTAETLNSTYTFYNYAPENYLADLGVNTAPAGLLKTGTTYWLASRCVDTDSTFANFNVRDLGYVGFVDISYLFNSDGETDGYGCAVRPVVSLESNVSFIRDTTKSTDEVTYWNIQY